MRMLYAPILVLAQRTLKRHTHMRIIGPVLHVVLKYIRVGMQQKIMEMAHGVLEHAQVVVRTHTPEEAVHQVVGVYVVQLNQHLDILIALE